MQAIFPLTMDTGLKIIMKGELLFPKDLPSAFVVELLNLSSISRIIVHFVSLAGIRFFWLLGANYCVWKMLLESISKGKYSLLTQYESSPTC